MTAAKVLLVYYSRTGNTRRLALAIARELQCDIEEIRETRTRLGVAEFIKSCFEALWGHHAQIEAVQHDPKSYDLIVIGTPVWTASVSTPVRGYLRAHGQDFRDVAFFATMGHRGSRGAFVEMQKLLGKKPLACCAVTAGQIAAGAFTPRVTQFVDEIGGHAKPARSGEQVARAEQPGLERQPN